MKTLLVLLFCLTIIIHTIYIAVAFDKITKTQFLKENNTIISPKGTFEMGFFSPGESKNWYIGIWYKFSVETVVWVANRENPMEDKTGAELKITDEGVLVLFNATNGIIWVSPNTTSRSSSFLHPVARLLDSGNLVIRDENDSNFDNFIWQSFDHPSDTQLPGMKISYSFKTGVERYLTTWKSSDDPGPGEYTYHLDPNGYPQLVIRRGWEKKYGSGPWVGDSFSGRPSRPSSGSETPATIYTRELNLNEEEVYFTYGLINDSVIMRSILDQSVRQRWIWNNGTRGWLKYLFAPIDECDEYSTCGTNGLCKITMSPICVCLNKFVPRFLENWNMGDWSGGCVRNTSLNCERGDKFLLNKNVKLPDTNSSWFNKSMNLEECKAKCLKNCSCSGYSNLDFRDGGSGCLLWFNELIDMRDMGDAGQEMYVRLASSELDDSDLKEIVISDDSNSKKKVIIAVSLVGIVLLGLSLSLYVRKKKAKLKIEKESAQDHGNNRSQSDDLEVPFFGLSTIAKATNNFSINNKLGEGGFGPVYKGVLEEGQEIAVKRLSKTSRQGFHEFKNEVICIAKLQHRNLVKLLGYCIQEDEYMLIYEYMPNNSLETFLFDETQRKLLLDWPKRFHIINGIARGLLYLHQDSRLRVIHRDLKASNVLLDFQMNPKISDFGLARCFGGDETEANTRRVVGTFGYMPPEYAADGLFSVKSDVFSFGVLVLEIVSGKKNRGFAHKDYRHNLLGHAWILHLEGKSLGLMDEAMDTLEECYVSEVLRSIQVGLLCVQQKSEDRPNMTSIVLMLGSEGPLPEPKQPGFFAERIVAGETSSSYSNAPSSWSIDGR